MRWGVQEHSFGRWHTTASFASRERAEAFAAWWDWSEWADEPRRWRSRYRVMQLA